jgi:uncharacterized Rmd1/YagE family protein
MDEKDFQAVTIGNELHLQKIANSFSISKKFKWEDPLKLDGNQLAKLYGKTMNGKGVYIYHFGSLVFINFQVKEIEGIIEVIKKLDDEFKDSGVDYLSYIERYRLHVKEGSEFRFTDEEVIVPENRDYYSDIIALILGQSVALRRIEISIDRLLDEIEGIIDYLEKGRLEIKDKKLAKTVGRILGLRFHPISYLMLLDKPELTWENMEAERFYERLAGFFELRERYGKIKSKTETLLNITEVFAGLTHEKRATRLEWIIIILILIEVIMYVLELIIL